ncbi:MAG: hypothetical protein ACLFPW_09450 [Spirochaetaceae bacterium]
MVSRKLVLRVLFLIIVPTALFGQSVEDPELDNIHLYREIRGLREAEAPRFMHGHLLFTYRPSEREQRSRMTRMVGISFAHERFSQVYAFKRLSLSDYPSEDLFYYVMPVPEGREELVYRIVVDGLWGTDPQNPRTRRVSGGVSASLVEIPSEYQGEESFPSVGEQRVRFAIELDEDINPFLTTLRRERIPTGEFADGTVYVAGSFNNWDPFMHRLRPDPRNPHRYIGSVRVPPGRHYYYFVVDGVRILDPNNSDQGFDSHTNTRASRLLVTP